MPEHGDSSRAQALVFIVMGSRHGCDLRDWLKTLDATYAELEAAVKAVGNQPANVRQYLKITLTCKHGQAPVLPAVENRDANGSHTVLLIIDLISCWDILDAAALLYRARNIVGPIVRLKRRYAKSCVATIYVNDNRGRWRSDFTELVALSEACGGHVSTTTR